MTANTDHLAIRTGHLFTVVTVDTGTNQCIVECADSTGHLFFSGTGDLTIRRAAQDGGGHGFKTLREAKESREGVIRAATHDC